MESKKPSHVFKELVTFNKKIDTLLFASSNSKARTFHSDYASSVTWHIIDITYMYI